MFFLSGKWNKYVKMKTNTIIWMSNYNLKRRIMSNLEIGKRIRTLRTEKGLSREAFCGDEKHLTVRQLARMKQETTCPA